MPRQPTGGLLEWRKSARVVCIHFLDPQNLTIDNKHTSIRKMGEQRWTLNYSYLYQEVFKTGTGREFMNASYSRHVRVRGHKMALMIWILTRRVYIRVITRMYRGRVGRIGRSMSNARNSKVYLLKRYNTAVMYPKRYFDVNPSQ